VKAVHRLLLCGASVLAVVPAVAAVAFAADEGVETVVVSGVRESLRDSLVAKRNAETITEHISTKDIGQLPDVTIAEELNRLPGLNTTTDRGNASQAAVRGLGPRLILGLVNGREVASPEPDQNVRWEIYPSEVVTGVQVYKSQTADLISGGIAATIDMQTVSPLDWTGPSFTLRAGPEYNDQANDLPHYSPWGFRGSTSFVSNLTENFAVALSASFQREHNGYESFQGWGYNLANGGTAGDVTGDGVNDSTPWGMQSVVNETQQDRIALMGAAQWKVNSDLELKFDLLYSAYTIHEDQYQAWYGSNNNMGNYTYPEGAGVCSGANAGAYDCGWADPPVTVQNGVITGAQMGNSYVSVTNAVALYGERHSLIAGGLNAKWQAGAWDVTADLSHSDAWRNNTWQAVLAEVYPTTSVFNTGQSTVPYYETYSDWNAQTLYNPADTTIQTVQSYRPSQVTGPEHTMDNLSAMKIDAGRNFENTLLSRVDFGIRYAARKKSHSLLSWYECPQSGAITSNACPTDADAGLWNSYTLPSNMLSDFTLTGYHVPPMLYGKFDQLAALVYPDFHGGFAAPAGADQLGQHWAVVQNDFEAYVKVGFAAELDGMPLTGGVGMRVAYVDSKSRGYLTADGVNFTPASNSKEYTDILPSLNLNLHVSEDKVVRFGASVAVSRPPLDELRIGNTLSTSAPYTGSQGNPRLNPYRADQLDLAYEWYFHDESLFAASVYYKHLNSFIGYQTFNETVNGHPYVIAHPVNGKGGDLAGLELTFQTRLYFLPGFLKDFGIYTNYAYVSSGLKEFAPVANPMEATGLAKHTAELDLWYSAYGVEARLAYKVHSPFTGTGWNAQQLYRVDWERHLDSSVSYQVNQYLGLRFEARNINNSGSRSYWDNNPSELDRYDVFGRSFLFDVTYKY
jgi:iron complex outermembrane recepter protein